MTNPPAVASNPLVASALHMLQLFGSVGADLFDITHTNIEGERTGFRRGQSLAAAVQSMPSLMAAADRRQRNIIVRPRSDSSTLIQLDDLDERKARLTSPAAFLILETSPANFQSWVAVSDCVPGITARLRKGAGADKNASGATRMAGTTNYKLRYAPDFPRVQTRAGKRGHIVTVAQLDELRLLAPAVITQKPQPIVSVRTHKWPSYQQCLDRAPLGDKGHPSRTSVDFVWCKIAASWGHSVEEIAARLMAESTKAEENGQQYAVDTASRASWSAQHQPHKRILAPEKAK